MHPSTHVKAAVWVPDDDPQRPWDEAAEIAADWIWDRSAAEGIAPLLVTNTFQNGIGIECLDQLARGRGQATPQGKQRFDGGPVLAYVPYGQALKLALDLARGYSLAVVETAGFPLAEWAAGAEATTSNFAPEVRTDLDSAVFFGGRNGWTGKHEKQHAQTCLDRHIRAGRLSPDQAAAYAMSQGVSDKGAKRLRALVEKLGQSK